ncbi:MAG: SgcJ/EcaC family oxidoreductase [Thermoanaerobaculia bacterium]
MRRISMLATLALGLLAGPALHGAGEGGCARKAEDAVKALLATQSAAWNRGDLEGFTAVYAEDASFLSPSGITHGRHQVLERYRLRYPDKKAMGTLTLDVQEARTFPAQGKPCDIPGVSVAAHWKLAYPDQPEKKTAEGSTLLVLRPRAGAWEIVQDASM